MHAHRSKDIEALNALQVIRASDNLYFNKQSMSDYVATLTNNYILRRPVAWHNWTFAVEQAAEQESELRKFGVVKTPEEFRTGNGFMHSKSISVDPGIWCSLFFIRPKPKFYDTESGAGLTRSKDLMSLRNAVREPLPKIIIPRAK